MSTWMKRPWPWRQNGNANSVRLDVVHSDAFGYARQMAQNARSYGVIVLDPPKLIFDRDEISAGKRKYFDLNVLAMKLIERGGLLVSCSCSGLLGPQEFLALLGAAARNAEREVQLLALDRRSARPSRCDRRPRSAYLKVAWLKVGGESRLPDRPAEP